MASGKDAYSTSYGDQVPLVAQTSWNTGRAGEDQPRTVVTRQPSAAPSVILMEDAFWLAVMSVNPDVIQIKIDEPSQAQAISNLAYNLKLFGEPHPTLKILTDVRAKEYANHGAGSDTMEVSMSKKRDTCLGSGFKFTLLNGIQMGDDHQIGPSIFNATGNNVGSLLIFNENDSINEKVTVPPHTKTVTTVKTNLVKYEGEATIDVHALASRTISYKYVLGGCCANCCRCGRKKWHSGKITMGQLFRGQSGFQIFGPLSRYTAKYAFTYFGEQFDIVKEETKLYGSS